MLEILRDPIWQFLGVVLTVVISIVLFRLQRQRKELSYEIVAYVPLVSVIDELEGKIKILYEDKLVQGVYLAVIRVTNSGNTPIVSGDYEFPLSFNFDESVDIFSAEIVGANPANIRPEIAVVGRNVILEPVLLNSKDSVMVKVLTSKGGEISVGGRISGVRSIKEVSLKRTRMVLTIPILILNLILLILVIGFASLWPKVVYPIAAAVSLAVLILKIVRMVKTKQMRQ